MTVQSRIDSLATGSGEGCFSQVSRVQLVQGLRERVANPDSLYQGVASLCGPTSLIHCLLRDNAEAYVGYVVDLWTTGRGRIGTLNVRPGEDCRNATPRGIAAVDWVALASLRDSENTILDYDEPADQVAGITMPGTLAAWFRAAGYQDVRNVTNVWFTKGESDINTATALLRQGKRVCLFINADLVQHGASGGGRTTVPDHWVELVACNGIRDGRVRGAVLWTWARRWPLPDLTVEQFCGNFFGYVAGRYGAPPAR